MKHTVIIIIIIWISQYALESRTPEPVIAVICHFSYGVYEGGVEVMVAGALYEENREEFWMSSNYHFPH